MTSLWNKIATVDDGLDYLLNEFVKVISIFAFENSRLN